MNLSKSEYKALISDVEREFGLYLAKSEESEEINDGEEHEIKNAITGEDAEKESDTIEEQDKDEEHNDKEIVEQAEESDENDRAHGYDEGEMEELHKIYSEMDKSELSLHKEMLDRARNGGESDNSEVSSNSGDAEMEKSEKTHVTIKQGKLLKSEVRSLKERNKSLEKSMAKLLTVVEGYVTSRAPARKAITEIGVLGKSEISNSKQYNKSEIITILDTKTKEASLSKSDRDAINNYCSGKGSVEQIKHLLGN